MSLIKVSSNKSLTYVTPKELSPGVVIDRRAGVMSAIARLPGFGKSFTVGTLGVLGVGMVGWNAATLLRRRPVQVMADELLDETSCTICQRSLSQCRCKCVRCSADLTPAMCYCRW